jgi:hypothetical protein
MNFAIPESERRTRRSNDPLVALHYQLAEVRQKANLQALVLADTSGVVVAGSGSWPVCEELAAYAPLLDDCKREHDGAESELTQTLSKLRTEVVIEHVLLDAGDPPILLCGRSTHFANAESTNAFMRSAAQGVLRILSA